MSAPAPGPLALVSAFALFLALPCAIAVGGTGAKGDGERLKNLLSRDPKGAGVREQPLPARLASIQAATNVPREALEECRTYELDDGALVIGFADLEWTGPKRRIGAAFDAQGALKALGAFDEHGKPAKDLEAFLAQFQGQFGVRLTKDSEAAIGPLLALRDDLASGKKPPVKPQERLKWTLLRQRQTMWKLESLERAIEAELAAGKPVPGTLAKELREALEETKTASADLKSLFKPKDLGEYRKYLDEMVKQAEAAEGAIAAGDPDAARKSLKVGVLAACAKCHGHDQNQWKRSFQAALRDERNRLGVPDGSFVVDLDVRRGDLPLEQAQAVASTVKAAFLLGTAKR